MENSRVEEFLDLYKQLEQLLKKEYANDSGRYDSVVARYENSKDCGNWGDEIHTIRNIRNLLQHNPKMNGNYVVTPSDDIMAALRAVIQDVEHPKLAIDYGVKTSQMYKTTLSSRLMNVINVMKERGFSQIPVIENNKLYGVISAYAFFDFATEQGVQILTEDTKVKDMKAYLPIDKHRNEYYLFLPRTATFTDADEAFEKRDNKKRRLVAVFITEHGLSDEPVLSMLTPWSVVGK
ncbi:MAG: hypothetical protein IKP86_10475 [Anaerolineaceae bacterium]|nr:hypothetical protein [Anaerolineaceae bacterium]